MAVKMAVTMADDSVVRKDGLWVDDLDTLMAECSAEPKGKSMEDKKVVHWVDTMVEPLVDLTVALKDEWSAVLMVVDSVVNSDIHSVDMMVEW